MSTAKWSTLGTTSSELSGTTLNSLANGSESAQFTTYDNSSNLDLYGRVEIGLGSFTSTTGASISLNVYNYAYHAAVMEDKTGAIEHYVVPLTVGASAKVVVVPMVRLYPGKMAFTITNNAGAALASSSNSVYLTPYDESIA